jgi:transcription factor C subunit 7
MSSTQAPFIAVCRLSNRSPTFTLAAESQAGRLESIEVLGAVSLPTRRNVQRLTCASEFFGRADFEHPHPPTLQVLTHHFDYLDQDHVSTHIPSSKGEMIVELHERVRNALDHIITTLDNDPAQPKTLLICSHAATIIAAGRVLTGQMPDDPDTDDFQCFTAGLSKFVRKSTDPEKGVAGTWDCVLNSETSFLSGGAERGW